MLRDIPLSYIVSIVATGILLSVSALYAGSVSSAVSDLTVDVAGQSLDVVAERVEETIQQSIGERLRDLDQAIVAASKHSGSVQQALSHWILHDSESAGTFEWIAQLDSKGSIIAQSGKAPPPNDLGYWTSFAAQGSREPSSYAALNSLKAAGRDNLTIDLMVPVADGLQFTGILAARVDASFVYAIAAATQGYGQSSAIPDLIVLDSDLRFILGPSGIGKLPEQVSKALKGHVTAKPFVIAPWPDGETYIAGFSTRTQHSGLRGPSWTILVRQPAAVQLAPLVMLKNRIWLYATFFVLHGILFAWIISSLVCGPLLRLAHAADAIRDGKTDAAMPVENSCREAQLLSKSLVSLVGTLKEREQAQALLAASLEEQVKVRTAELSDSNERLQQANQLAQEAIKSKTRFLASASHDLRQPLQSLVLVTRQLVRRFSSGDDGRLMSRMEQSVTSLSRMFNQLLDLSRLDTGIVQARIAPISVAKLLDRIAEDTRSEAHARGLRFKYVSGDYVIASDAVILETIIRNLLSNAMKFTSRGGILLGVRSAGPDIEIRVYDTGPGIGADNLPELFKEFYRVPLHAAEPTAGLGLGLSIVRRYAGLIGAEVFVHSKVGRGSCFGVRLARLASPVAETPPPRTLNEAEFWKQRRIVVVEDDPCVRTAIEAELAETCASVTSFSSAKSAACAIKQGLPFDVVIADYDLKDDAESGLIFIDRLRKSQLAPFSPLILTGRTDLATITMIEAAGTPWLAKPATTHDMAALLQGATHANSISRVPVLAR